MYIATSHETSIQSMKSDKSRPEKEEAVSGVFLKCVIIADAAAMPEPPLHSDTKASARESVDEVANALDSDDSEAEDFVFQPSPVQVWTEEKTTSSLYNPNSAPVRASSLAPHAIAGLVDVDQHDTEHQLPLQIEGDEADQTRVHPDIPAAISSRFRDDMISAKVVHTSEILLSQEMRIASTDGKPELSKRLQSEAASSHGSAVLASLVGVTAQVDGPRAQPGLLSGTQYNISDVALRASAGNNAAVPQAILQSQALRSNLSSITQTTPLAETSNIKMIRHDGQSDPAAVASLNNLGALSFDSRKGVQLPNIIPQLAMLLEPKIFTQSIASDALILDELDVISVVPDARSGHVPSPASAPVVDARAVSAALAPVVAQQVAIAVHKAPGGVVEIILNPEELGRVRVSMQAQDGVMTMTITTERGETQELMRRHIDALAQEMRALGYRDVGFNFQGQSGDGGNNQRGSADKQSPEIEHPVLETTLLAVTSGLDLRL